jgi:tetratricopeptide (TPR) repeat protein
MTSRKPGWLGGLVALLFVVVFVVAARPARAQDAPPPKLTDAQKRQTTEHYERATKYYNVGKYAEAITEYQAAYLISADPRMLYNIAQCHRLSNQPEEAARFFKNFLRNAPNTSLRADVEKKIEDMERLAEERRRQGGGTTAGSPTPTGTPTEPTPPDPASPTGPAAQVPPPITPPDPSAALPGPPPEGAVQQSLPPPAEPPSRVLPLTLLIGSGTLVVTSLVSGAIAGSKAKQVEEKSREGVRFDDSVEKLQKAGKAANGLAVLTGLAGLVAGGVGVFLWLRSSPDEAAAPTAALFPIAGPGLAGAGISARF